MDYINIRAGLPHLKAALKRGKVTVGFVGGSITSPTDGRRWSDKFADWFVFNYPGVRLTIENAAKGATGANSAVFRVEKDILPAKCDIVFVETAVNDEDSDFRLEYREGMLRKLLKKGTFDVVAVYTYCQRFYDAMFKGELPESMREWEELCEYYGLSSVNMARFAFDMTVGGYTRWQEWLPDGLHPEFAGSRLYADKVGEFVKAALKEKTKAVTPLPAPLYKNNWENAYVLDFDKVELNGAWRLVRERRVATVDYLMYTPSVHASMKFEFEGRGVTLCVMCNKHAAGFRYRIDGGEWQKGMSDVPSWAVNSSDFIRTMPLVSNLEDKKHVFELEPVFIDGNTGTDFELATIGIQR